MKKIMSQSQQNIERKINPELFQEIQKNRKLLETNKQVKIKNRSTENLFNPEIKKDDNSLTVIVKSEINRINGIDLKDYIDGVNSVTLMDASNFKRGLINCRKMSTERFNIWMTILGSKYKILYYKNYKIYQEWLLGERDLRKIKDKIKNYEYQKTKNIDNTLFVPEINGEEDFLLLIVKKVIKLKGGIDLNQLVQEGLFKSKLEANNYKIALSRSNNMTIERFEEWAYILNIKWKILYGEEYKKYKKWYISELKKIKEGK